MGEQGHKPGDGQTAPNVGDIDFLAAVGHDLRTQVGIVLTTAELLLESPLNERQTRHATMLHDAAAMLNTLLGDLLDHAKLEAGSFSIEERAFAPATLFGAAVDAVRPRAEAKGVAVDLELDATVPPRLTGDPLRIRQILANLLDNAVKFTDSGSVRVAVRVDHGREALRLVFAVADTGIGLDPDQQARVFLPYAQAEAGTARHYGGTGLGLTIARALAERMGGGLGVVSRKGAGTTFTAVVGCHAAGAPENEDAAAVAALADSEPLAGVRVLLVDDNAVNRTLISMLLERFSVGCRAVASGAEAI
ncbi:MAG TPA: ATP-binding protein, partial [Hyphomicrobiales bacterium]|nr:ATP-binding protein [Hyphomicrobiales bacterium]